MIDELKERLIRFFTSRLTILTVMMIVMGGILIYRCFNLQIVQGEEYLNQFILQTEKTRDLSSSRGRILDRNGVVLAEDKLAYVVKIEDVFESNSSKNRNLNDTIYRLIKIIEKNGDSIITDFDIIIDENGDYAFNVEGTGLLRFLADVYGRTTIDKLKDEERAATADEVMEFLGGTKKFAIGEYEEEGNTKTKFIVGKGYTKTELLQVMTIRYAMNLTSFRKYIATTVATDVNDQTVTVIMENSEVLDGVTIETDTIRWYTEDSFYFAHILGYTGKISPEELKNLNSAEEEEGGNPERYNINDIVGKSGIESYMERELQGVKGNEVVCVDNMGKVISILSRTEAEAGNDVYLTIDHDYQIAYYHILEQKIAGIVADKIINAKEYIPSANASNSDIRIPIYDVYFAVINNNILDIRHFGEEDAGEMEKEVYEKYLEYQGLTYEKLLDELYDKKTPYNKLSKEYQVYQSNIVSMLNKKGIIDPEQVDANDPTQIAWASEEVISLGEYLEYVISKNWIDVTKLELESKYSDSGEIFDRLSDYIIDMVDNELEFQKKLYKYMLLRDVISGKDICMLLCEQNAIEIPEEDEEELYSGKLSSYHFMMNRINNLDITPAQLALDPCNGSIVVTDNHTGDVLAMVSYPGYDNNMMANSVDADYYARLLSDKSSPSLNYATQYKAAPGSTFKMVSAAAGLSEGFIDLNTGVTCVGTFTDITPSPRCWRISGHGRQTVSSAIQHSCNYFFYQLGYNMSFREGTYNGEAALNILADYADLFGLTEKSGVEIAEYEPDISTEDPVRSAIGQGKNSYTTAGLARYTTAVATGGTCYNLTLLDKMTDSAGNVIKEYEPDIRNTIDMPQQYWDAIHAGMRGVVQGKVYFNGLAVTVAGKTGTAEQSKIRPNHALFICYAPYEDPDISMAVRIPYGYSSDYAAQVACEIIKYHYGLAEEEEIITGTADAPAVGVTNEM